MYFLSETHLDSHIHGIIDEEKSDTTFVEYDEDTTESTIEDHGNNFSQKSTKSISTMKKMIHRVDEIQRSVEDKKRAIQATQINKGQKEHKDISDSARYSCTKEDNFGVDDTSMKHILDNLATKKNCSTICTPGNFLFFFSLLHFLFFCWYASV